MAESQKVDTLVFCLGPVGGQDNPIYTKGSEYTSKYDYTINGYARYIEEANNMIKFQYLIINYFLDSVKSEFEEDPLAFIDAEKEELQASVQKMKKQWKVLFKEHKKKLREFLKNKKEAIEKKQQCSDEGSGSSAKMPRLDPEAAMESGSKLPESPLEAASVEKIEFPENVFLKKMKDFARVLKTEYLELRARMGKTLDRVPYKGTVHDLKGFTLQNMEKFAKWKYDLKTLAHLVNELESKLGELDLDFEEIKENENRLTQWMYFDDGKKDRRYHHRLLITLNLTRSVSEISAITWKQIRRWKKISKTLASKLPTESEAFEEKVKIWMREIVPPKKPMELQKSIESDDTLYGADDMPEET